MMDDWETLGVNPLFPGSGEVYRTKDGFMLDDIHGGKFSHRWLQDNFEARNDDLFVASFPKTGTTWVQELAFVIGTDLDFARAKASSVIERFPYIEFKATIESGLVTKATSPRFLKTHYPYSLLPQSVVDKKCKISCLFWTHQGLYKVERKTIQPYRPTCDVNGTINILDYNSSNRCPVLLDYERNTFASMKQQNSSLGVNPLPSPSSEGLSPGWLPREDETIILRFVFLDDTRQSYQFVRIQVTRARQVYKDGLIIYPIRNPKDTLVSLYHYSLLSKMLDYKGDFETFFHLFIEDKVFCAPFSKHILEFWERRNQDNILILHFEDMKKDIRTAIRQIAEFLGKTLTDDEVEKVADHCSFDKMKKNPATNYKSFLGADSTFMRKGIVGDWKNHFTDEMDRKMDDYIQKRFAGTGLELKWR